jgi:hypothetical protein
MSTLTIQPRGSGRNDFKSGRIYRGSDSRGAFICYETNVLLKNYSDLGRFATEMKKQIKTVNKVDELISNKISLVITQDLSHGAINSGNVKLELKGYKFDNRDHLSDIVDITVRRVAMHLDESVTASFRY